MKSIVLSFLLLTFLPSVASAGDLDYTYLEFGLSQNHLTGVEGGSGFALNGSTGLPLGFFLDGSLEDFAGLSASLRRTTAHAGWHVGVMDSLDLVFRLGSTNVAADYGYSSTSYDANAGLRAQLPAGFEVEADFGNAGASYSYFPGTGFGLGGPAVTAVKEKERYESAALRYHVADDALLGLSYRTGTSHDFFNGDTTLRTWLLAMRFTF